ncbi:MAG TPA: V-type ATP synthase subunit I [Sedimentisphaerales bacterium]|nr:V-type ATP synthase subunit I [Sedimentisphaerales bacterium]HRS09814.1 V-type ATP synthase subunit I [Sedimentisphaerales bacterium]HRV46536.1 V-type ATP synthase subunit I [Sedimentisphaerales bacterium]
MALVKMAKVLIVCHRSQAADLLEQLQQAGIVEILDAQRAMVSRQAPELQAESRRPRDIEETHTRLERAVGFLRPYRQAKRSLFEPLPRIDGGRYAELVSGENALDVLNETEQLSARMDRLANECDATQATLDTLRPWEGLATPVEEIGRLHRVTCWTGLIPSQHVAQASAKLTELGATLQQVGTAGSRQACLIVALNERAEEVHKALRSVEYEAVSFEGMQGTVAELIAHHRQRLDRSRRELEQQKARAAQLAGDLLKLEILDDHYRNVLSRETVRGSAPGTEQTVLLEGWVRAEDYAKLERIVGRFDAAGVGKIDVAEGEEKPVEIENTARSRPFEVITRLYGMPHSTDVDPTPFLAPFFALFFGICLTDAAYGIVMIAVLWWVLKKVKGDAKFIKMMIACSVTTVIAGALTGGWCGDAIQVFLPQLNGFRNAVMWFDPLEKPMHFFYISLALGYLQIIFAIGLAFWHKWKRGDRREAIFDHGTWFVWLNSLMLFGLAKAGVLPAGVGRLFGYVALVPALGIVLFSERQGSWGARIGMGCYNVFSTVFYVGDVLSYIRLMALGMVTAGFGMAVNSIVMQVMKLGVPGWILGIVIFVGGHVFNIANSCLSAFVHSMRLQFVEFFTKFLQGGGREFEPLRKEYRHIQVDRSSAD